MNGDKEMIALDTGNGQSSSNGPIGEQPKHKGGVQASAAKQSSTGQAAFTLFKCFLGTGILALPVAFKTAGLGLAIIGIIIVGVLTYHCFVVLLEAAEDKIGREKMSLQKFAFQVLGRKGQNAVQVSLIIMQLAACIGLLIFAKNFLDHVFCSHDIKSMCGNYAMNAFFSLILTVPLAFINNMHYFYIPSLAATFFVIIGLATQMFYNADRIGAHPEIKASLGARLSEFHFTQIPLFFGVAIYAYEGIGMIFSLRASMEKPQEFPFLLKVEMALITLIYILFPTMSYVAFGENTPEIIFFSLPTDEPFYLLVQILFAISALFSYPIQMFPAVRIIENSKKFRYQLFDEKGHCINKKLRYTIRMALVGVIYLIAYTTKSFHLFVNLIGSCVFTFLGFILPIWMYQTQFRGRVPFLKRVMNYATIVIGTIFGSLGFVISLKEIFSGSEGEGGEVSAL